MTATATSDVDDPLMATACPMHLIAGVKITNIKRGGVVDRKIEVVVDCGCKYFLSLEPGKRAPRRGELSHCRGNCKT